MVWIPKLVPYTEHSFVMEFLYNYLIYLVLKKSSGSRIRRKELERKIHVRFNKIMISNR